MKKLYRLAENITADIIHISYSSSEDGPVESNLINTFAELEVQEQIGYEIAHDDSIFFSNKQGETVLNEFSRELSEKPVYEYIPDGIPVLDKKNTANGEVASIGNLKKRFAKNSYSAVLQFSISRDEIITGLGQSEDGVFNYRGRKEYLYQNNMKIAIPFLISTKNYGILIDTESSVIFESRDNTLTFSIDTAESLSYYIIRGANFDEIIFNLRHLTGRASMLPRWTFGYMQSKERYESSDELLDISTRFREEKIPLDCIIQDWRTWEDENWGEKTVDKRRFPELPKTVESLHKENTKVMFSIWPNMAPGGTNYKEFIENDAMLPNSNIYDAYDENARDIYWNQCEKELFSSGLDAFWCDNTEPFSDPDWNGEHKRPEEERYDLVISASKKSMDWNKINSYALYHIKGLYENWRKKTDKKRVVILTRSLYTSGQQYGAIAWSGDISAKWSVLKNQIVEGQKMALSGIPYWTLDIGGFFTVRDKWENRGCNSHLNTNPLWFWDGDYNDGVQDSGYRELYTRWLQLGTFLPLFRSHGTDTPREPWNFGKQGELFYDTIVKFINLRYYLMPYVYSLAAGVHYEHKTMMRSLLFDFADDRKAAELTDTYMFGSAFLVSPVTRPMYFDIDSQKIPDAAKVKEVYLPEGSDWYDYWNNDYYLGGQTIDCAAPLEQIPLFVKSGSIIPVSEELSHADEKNGLTGEILVYSGADGEFTIYNDEGNNYSFEVGNFYMIKIRYNNEKKELSFDSVKGKLQFQSEFCIRYIRPEEKSRNYLIEYDGSSATLRL